MPFVPKKFILLYVFMIFKLKYQKKQKINALTKDEAIYNKNEKNLKTSKSAEKSANKSE